MTIYLICMAALCTFFAVIWKNSNTVNVIIRLLFVTAALFSVYYAHQALEGNIVHEASNAVLS